MSVWDEYNQELDQEEVGFSFAGQDLDIGNEVQEEIDAWSGRVETDSEVYERLQAYWDNLGVTGWTPSGTPWSGAFVSYILRNEGFDGDGLHAAYVRDIMDNKYRNWSAHSIPLNLYANDGVEVNIGDVLLAERSGSYTAGHGDVVYRIDESAGKVYLVGGNLSNGLRVRSIDLMQSPDYASRALSGGASGHDKYGYKIILKKGLTQKKMSLPWYAYVAAGLGIWILTKS